MARPAADTSVRARKALMTTSPTTHDAGFTGSKVLDPKGQPIGKVSDVVFDGTTAVPTWMVVKPGLFQAEHFVPVRGSYRTEADRVVVPFDRQHVKAAPKAAGDHVITSEKRALLAQHYHLVD